MVAQIDNPTIAPMLRVVFGITSLVLIAGASLFFFPDFVVSHWPWSLAPFNTRFLGGIYVLELTALAIAVITNSWAPARLVLPLSFFFASLVTLVSLFYVSRFDFSRWITYVWFLLYGVAVVVFGYFLWYYRNTKPAGSTATPPGWRGYFLAQGAIFGLYGVGLLVLPGTFSGFWPWVIDDFHARMYCTIFLLLPVGMAVLYRAAAHIEFFTMGVMQIVLAVCSVLGLVLVDLSAHHVNWSSAGTWVWIAGFAVLFLSGAVMVNEGISRGLFRSPATIVPA